MNELALFAGAGGGLLAGRLLGWRTVCAVEWNDYARRVLVARQNDGSIGGFPIWDDVSTFDGKPWRGRVDVVSGGFPCQAFSMATHGRPTAANRWPDMRRIISEVQPTFVFAENVAAKAIEAAANDLEQDGYSVTTLKLSVADLGGDHIRARYWLRAHSDMRGELCRTEHAETRVRQSIRSRVWDSYSDESRILDGMAHRVERIDVTGNGQVPCVAAAAWELMS